MKCSQKAYRRALERITFLNNVGRIVNESIDEIHKRFWVVSPGPSNSEFLTWVGEQIAEVVGPIAQKYGVSFQVNCLSACTYVIFTETKSKPGEAGKHWHIGYVAPQTRQWRLCPDYRVRWPDNMTEEDLKEMMDNLDFFFGE